MTVAEVSANQELLVCSRLQEDMRRQNLDVIEARVILFRPGCASGNPFSQDFVFQRTDLEPLSAFVRQGGGGFQQQQTAARIGRDNPASERVAGEREEIAFIIVAAE